MQTVLVTGGTGLVGTAIERVSRDPAFSNHTFRFISSRECDLTDGAQTHALFDRIRPNYVIHLAARVGGLFRNMREKVDMLEDNIAINSNVLRACHAFNVTKCVSCLSTCIFPDKTRYPIDETMLHDGPPHESNAAYAYAKRLVDVQSRAYRDQYGDNFVTVIPTNIYGPGDNYNLRDGHVIPALIHKCFVAQQIGDTFDVAGTGKPLRQFIYSDDLAWLIMWVMVNYDDAEPIILSPPEESEESIAAVAHQVAYAFGYVGGLNITGEGGDGQFKKTACNRKLMEHIGDTGFVFTPIADGIRKSVAWFIANYDDARK